MTWLEHAATYAAMKWPNVSAHSRAGIAEALATITPALTRQTTRRPSAAVLRDGLYGWAFNPGRADCQPPAHIADALDWAARHSLLLAALTDPQLTRHVLDTLTLRLDCSRAAAATIARKRAVFHNALGYAAELGLLPSNPLRQVSWRSPQTCTAVSPLTVASPAQVERVLAEVTLRRPELTAFFGCLYYGALRPEEAVALTISSCQLPPARWGTLILSSAVPRTAVTWTGTGAPHEHRGLKLRPQGATRAVPIPPQLVEMLRQHIATYGTADDGRLFPSPRGGPLHESVYGRIWQTARTAALCANVPAGALLRRPYDLRHSALSLWLAAGVPPAEIASRAGHSVQVLLKVYAHSVPGYDEIANRTIEASLQPGDGPRVAHEIRPWTGPSRPLYVRATTGPNRTQSDTAGL